MSEGLIATPWTRASRVCRILGWLTAGFLVLAAVTGYGVTEALLVTSLTLGLLPKAIAQQMHSSLEIPLLAALALHVSASLLARRTQRERT